MGVLGLVKRPDDLALRGAVCIEVLGVRGSRSTGSGSTRSFVEHGGVDGVSAIAAGCANLVATSDPSHFTATSVKRFLRSSSPSQMCCWQKATVTRPVKKPCRPAR